MKPIRFLAAFLLAFHFSCPVFAADDTNLPSGSSAEVLEKKTRKEAEETMVPKKVPEKPQVVQKKPVIKSKATFFVRKITLEGNDVVPPESLKTLIHSYEGRKATFADLNLLAKELEEIFRNRGYFAVVIVPPQKIQHGEVKLQVLISRMGLLQVEGGRYFRKWKIRSYWKIPKGQTLRYDKIRESVRALNDNPDRTVKPVLQAGAEKGTTDVHLKVEDQIPVHAGTFYDNQGVRITGKQRNGITFRHNNFLGLDDIFLIGTVFGRDYGAMFLQHLIPLTNFGTRFSWGFSHAQVRPKGDFKHFDINGTSETYGLKILQKVLERDLVTVDSHLGIDFKEKLTRSQGAASAWDKLRVLNFGWDMLSRDRTGNWGLTQDIFAGFSPHGNGFPLNSREGQTHFWRYTFGVRRIQQLPYKLKGVINFEGQLTPYKLLPQEQLFLGGADSVRGYPENDYGADQGLFTNYELWAPFFLVPSSWKFPRAEETIRQQIQLVGFCDYGFGALHSTSPTEQNNVNMLSLGGGFAVHLGKNVTARLEWAHAIGNHPLTEGGTDQFHFRLKAEV